MLAERGAEVFYLTIADDLIGVLDKELPSQAATRQLHSDQIQAAMEIGMKGQYRLNFPAASLFDHFDVRKGLIEH